MSAVVELERKYFLRFGERSEQ